MRQRHCLQHQYVALRRMNALSFVLWSLKENETSFEGEREHVNEEDFRWTFSIIRFCQFFHKKIFNLCHSFPLH
jgi:hypothetical protein